MFRSFIIAKNFIRNHKFTFLKFSVSIIIIIAAVSTFWISACDTVKSASTEKSQLITEGSPAESNNFLDVGIDSTFPPFAFILKDKVTGFDADIAEEIASRLQMKLRITQISWAEIFDKINDPSIDIIISGISADKDKEKLADFSDPYYTLEFIILTLKTSDIKKADDLKNKKIGVLKSEVNNLDPASLSEYSSISQYDDINSLIKAFKSSEVHGILISIPIGVKILSEDPETYNFVQKIKSNVQYSIVLKKNSELKDKINSIIKDLKEDGTYSKIYDKWFKI